MPAGDRPMLYPVIINQNHPYLQPETLYFTDCIPAKASEKYVKQRPITSRIKSSAQLKRGVKP